MLKINIICIGKIKKKYFSEAIAEYSKRLGAFCKSQIIELAEERIRDNNPNASQIDEVLKAEGRRILSKISASDFVAAMCIEGKQLSSEELSDKLDKIALSGKSLSDEVKSRADLKLSMSRMTFPHTMARMILCEQIYRAFEISTNGKYHK